MYISPISNYYNKISFTGNKKTPVYSIDPKGNCKRYESKTQAAYDLGVTQPVVSRAASRKYYKAGGYVIVKPEEIESKDENGRVFVDNSKVKNVINRSAASKGVYAIDREGNYTRYDSRTIASEELGIARNAINSVIAGCQRTSGGYLFVDADKIEAEDEKGDMVVDKKKLNKAMKRFEVVDSVYAIDKDGNYTRYDSQTAATKELGVTRADVNNALLGKQITAKGYFFVKADEVETYDEEGRGLLDSAKLQVIFAEKTSLLNPAARGKRKPKSIYAIDQNGRYRKFNSRQEASEALGMSISSIGNVFSGFQNACHGLTFAFASELETQGENGEVTVDKEKLQKLREERFSKKTIFFE